jgi:hypothetical protein
MIPVEECFAAWPQGIRHTSAAYNALEDEFAGAAATAMQQRISFEPAPAR